MKKQSKSLDKLMQNMQALQESGDGKLSGGFELLPGPSIIAIRGGETNTCNTVKGCGNINVNCPRCVASE
jgi:hypothetical protein